MIVLDYQAAVLFQVLVYSVHGSTGEVIDTKQTLITSLESQQERAKIILYGNDRHPYFTKQNTPEQDSLRVSHSSLSQSLESSFSVPTGTFGPFFGLPSLFVQDSVAPSTFFSEICLHGIRILEEKHLCTEAGVQVPSD